MIASSRRWRAEVVKRRLELQQAGKKGEELLRVGMPRTIATLITALHCAHTTETDGTLCV